MELQIAQVIEYIKTLRLNLKHPETSLPLPLVNYSKVLKNKWIRNEK